MIWKTYKRERYALMEQDGANPSIFRGTFYIGPRHVKHYTSKEFVENAYVENPDFASEKGCKVFAQCSNIAIEVYDFYNKLFDPDYETVSVYDERFEVQYLFKEKWRSVDYYNPRIEVIPLEDGVDIKKVFDTDYGAETFEITYTIRTGSLLKHTIIFTNKMGQQRTFRVVMKVSGITSDKVKHGQVGERITKERHIITPVIFFGEDNKHLRLSEYLWSLGEMDEETGEWTSNTLKDIVLDTHAQGCKADIIIGNYTLAQNESLEIDPDTSTFYVGGGYDDAYEKGDGTFNSTNSLVSVNSYPDPANAKYKCGGFRFVSVSIPQGATISAAKLSVYFSNAIYDDADFVIYGNDVDNAEDFQAEPDGIDEIISTAARPRTSASVSWVQDALGVGWKDKTGLQDIVEEIVGRASWSSSNALVLLLIANIGVQKRTTIYSYEAGYAAKLEVTWTPPAVTEKFSSDSGTGIESIVDRAIALADLGTGTEAILSRAIALFESGIGAEASVLLASLTAEDVAIASEVAQLISALASSDTGTGSEAVISRLMTLADSGIGLEAATRLGRLLRLIIITSQYRQLNIITAQNRMVKSITSMYRKAKSITTGG